MEVDRIHGLWAELAARAFRSGSGEYAWLREDAIASADALSAAADAVLGGEVWLVDELGQIQGLVSAKDSRLPGVHHWEVLPEWEPSSESWLELCRRAA